ncbi:MAG TPA: TIGR01244 family sulfur transferase [Caulobacteraceae bacterium]|jgi:uncharacterized protein (TIGR01244 family)|nr:TIGR01244 family sulfur transferase [Caulobacteraceae bacterium]
MTQTFHPVTGDFAVAGQIEPSDVAAAAAQGFRLIVNNRPDGEEPGQPSGAEIEAAARAAGLAYTGVPIRGRPGPAQIEAMTQALAAADGPVLAYCRSGMRSIAAWALSEGATGARTRMELVGLARDAGFDLSQVL